MTQKKKTQKKEEGKEMPFESERDGMTVHDKVVKVDEPLSEEYMNVLKDLQQQVADLKTQQAAVSTALDEEGVKYDNPIEDYMTEPAVFFAFSSWFAIYGDKQYNREVKPPRGEPVVFQKLYRYPKKSQNKRGVEVISVSQTVIRSKTTADYLRSHSLFQIKFFENISKVQNVNVTLAEKMSDMNAVVSNMNDHQVIERARREELQIGTSDIRELRKMLIRNMAEDALKSEAHIHELKIGGGERDKDGRKIEMRKIGDTDADLATTSVY